jgi:hypothetical protein
MKLMDDAVAGLTGEIPQENLAGLGSVLVQANLRGVEHPDLAAMCRFCGGEGLARKDKP